MPSIVLPKHFANYMDGSSVNSSDGITGYAGGPAVTAAWRDAFRQARGGMVLTFTDADWLDALECLDDYAETSAVGAIDARSQLTVAYDREDYRSYTAEIEAARKMRQRIATLKEASREAAQ